MRESAESIRRWVWASDTPGRQRKDEAGAWRTGAHQRRRCATLHLLPQGRPCCARAGEIGEADRRGARRWPRRWMNARYAVGAAGGSTRRIRAVDDL